MDADAAYAGKYVRRRVVMAGGVESTTEVKYRGYCGDCGGDTWFGEWRGKSETARLDLEDHRESFSHHHLRSVGTNVQASTGGDDE